MKLLILQVEDCPNAGLLDARLAEAASGLEGVTTEHVLVRDDRDAALFGMSGSPTLLVDGVDPFTQPGAIPSLSCRLYRDADGTAVAVPSVQQLRDALMSAVRARDPLALEQWRAGSTIGRHTTLGPGVRAVHRAVLRHFLDTGQPPARNWIATQATALGLAPDAAIEELARADLVHFGADDRVVVAYPFAGTPTPHRVEFADAPPVWSMCAIDALGIPQMTDRDAVISSRDPDTGEPIRVETRGGSWTFHPASTVVVIAQTGTEGTSALCICGHVNFYRDADRARAHLAAHPDLSGLVVDQATAIEMGGVVFGDLLREENSRPERS